MKEKKILSLLKRSLLLDGTAAYYLCQMGYGDLIGLKNVQWLELEKWAFSYEETVNQNFASLNILMSAQQVSKKIAGLRTRNESLIVSQIYTADRKKCWVGSYLYENEFRGRIAVSCYPLNNNINIGFLNRYRQQMLQNILIWLSNNKEYLCFVKNQPLVYTVRIDFDNYYVLSFANFSTDSIDEMEIYLENFPVNLRKRWFLADKGIWKTFEFKLIKKLGGERIILKIKHRLNYLDCLVLKFSGT